MDESTKPRLIDWVPEAMRSRHYRRRTEKTCWCGKTVAFLSWLATKGNVAAMTQNQALAALLLFPLDHSSVETTMIYTHVMNKGGRGVNSPLDALQN